jgi:hypothetical protein
MITLPDATAEVPTNRSFSSKSLKYKIKKGSRGEEKKRDDADLQRARLVLYRTDTPDRSVNIRAAMFIEASSWNKSLAA